MGCSLPPKVATQMLYHCLTGLGHGLALSKSGKSPGPLPMGKPGLENESAGADTGAQGNGHG